MASHAEPRTMRLIIAYKAIRGCVFLLFALGLSIALWRGEAQQLHGLAQSLREYVTHRLAIDTAELLLKLATPDHLALTSLAIGLDGAVGVVEAWLLHRAQRWAIWLVVAASSALVPWEIYELFIHFRLLRVALLILNILVVVYLGFQAQRHVAHGQRGLQRAVFSAVETVGQGDEKTPESK